MCIFGRCRQGGYLGQHHSFHGLTIHRICESRLTHKLTLFGFGRLVRLPGFLWVLLRTRRPWRANLSKSVTIFVALSALLWILPISCLAPRGRLGSMSSMSVIPWIAANGFFTSWTIPAVSCPMAANFSDRTSCICILLKRVCRRNSQPTLQ